MATMTREQWLAIAAVRMTRSVPALCGEEFPENIRFSVGFPKRKRGRGAQAPGAGLYSLHVSGESEGGFRECFISPTVGADDVGGTLLMALCDAAQGRIPSQADLDAEARNALRGMPPYPHDKMADTGHAGAAQGSRMHKATCPACGYSVRITRKWLAVGAPICPADHIPLICDTVGSSDVDAPGAVA